MASKRKHKPKIPPPSTTRRALGRVYIPGTTPLHYSRTLEMASKPKHKPKMPPPSIARRALGKVYTTPNEIINDIAFSSGLSMLALITCYGMVTSATCVPSA